MNKGDRVRVTFEGTYDGETQLGTKKFSNTGDGELLSISTSRDAKLNVEVLDPVDPHPVGTVVVLLERSGSGSFVYIKGAAYWLRVYPSTGRATNSWTYVKHELDYCNARDNWIVTVVEPK